MTDYCDMSDLPVEGCAHCQGHTAAEESGPRAFSFTASFDGKCVDCGDKIEKGELILKSTAGYVHEGCF